ncbi:UrcA family protein [Sphingopyxis sp. YR583]|jgi:UrcA family protein|uniref:UrcA family protein n=1 Tax=Sphingopyxis sp. YR583 TaxID=1881047 RepID=UPI000B83B0A8|nr:UrcA family protein [Sphingopyxis sp. YR583]
MRPDAVIPHRDIDLRTLEGREQLNDRIDRVALELCSDEWRLGAHFNRFNPAWCARPT